MLDFVGVVLASWDDDAIHLFFFLLLAYRPYFNAVGWNEPVRNEKSENWGLTG